MHVSEGVTRRSSAGTFGWSGCSIASAGAPFDGVSCQLPIHSIFRNLAGDDSNRSSDPAAGGAAGAPLGVAPAAGRCPGIDVRSRAWPGTRWAAGSWFDDDSRCEDGPFSAFGLLERRSPDARATARFSRDSIRSLRHGCHCRGAHHFLSDRIVSPARYSWRSVPGHPPYRVPLPSSTSELRPRPLVAC
jgi:hypothetical protein